MLPYLNPSEVPHYDTACSWKMKEEYVPWATWTEITASRSNYNDLENGILVNARWYQTEALGRRSVSKYFNPVVFTLCAVIHSVLFLLRDLREIRWSTCDFINRLESRSRRWWGNIFGLNFGFPPRTKTSPCFNIRTRVRWCALWKVRKGRISNLAGNKLGLAAVFMNGTFVWQGVDQTTPQVNLGCWWDLSTV